MIAQVTGRLLSKSASSCVVEAGGIGLRLWMSTNSLSHLPAEGDEVTVFTHLHVREDILDLYGFASESERRVFRMLIDVPNVGPKTALGVLSALPPAELARAVESKDVARLTRIDGVGKKTAERLVLELKERLPKLGPWTTGSAAAPGGGDEGRLMGALTNMGYRPADAQRAIRAVEDRFGKEPLSEILKEALRILAG